MATEEEMCVMCGKSPCRNSAPDAHADTCRECHGQECAFPLEEDGTCSMFWH